MKIGPAILRRINRIVEKKTWRGNMDVDDHQACTSMDITENDDTSDGDGIHWHFSQVKGNIEPDGGITSDADIISCVEFSHDGEFLATGDKGGRVVIFQRDQSGKFINGQRSTDYNVYSTFQSHEPEFDYLKSLEIEEKINQIKWLKRKNAANFILSTNDKTIKLWKISEREKKVADGGWNLTRNADGTTTGKRSFSGQLKLPKLVPMELIVEASPRRVYGNAHAYHVNSISVNSDQEIFLSADDLRINIWHLEITNESFNIVDIKPVNMEELTEVITAAEFHPTQCHWFVYSSSKGSIRLCDMRDRALCDIHAKLFEESEDPTNRSFFSEIIASVSDVKFSHNGRYLLTRDYLTAKVWDINMESGPVETYPVHDYLRSKLCTLYENDSIFDKFEVDWSGDDNHILTGSYNNFFRSFKRGVEASVAKTYEAHIEKSHIRLPTRRVLAAGAARVNKKRVLAGTGETQADDDVNADSLDFTKKILHTAWHPKQNIIALAATNRLYIFQDK
ncbi:serine/threonine protein phosphatase 2A, putative [Brugia malayi]|uniref:Serine/threonine-protein phosphatase 2A 55 kDa regulatory subunit B n=3 Tax=Brugia TaxID=6278 RepID=A0A0J9Y9U4_BRUMA|nr:serine/threonine protein phosphatase 2A, putative [Brugia malayi]CDQ05333.1 BMA-SUR-6, isoform c [Brugia malayi]VIO95447.1 serine/threonine protein phosphatase 2A, putative [Brugia malayi]